MSLEFDNYSLSDLVKIKYGKNQKKVQDDNGKYPIYGIGGLMGYSIKYLYDKHSVFIGKKGPIEKVKYIDEPFGQSIHYFILKLMKKLLSQSFFII